MSVWEPWDADEEELAGLHVIRERIPPSMRPALTKWLYDRLHSGYSKTSPDIVNALQTALRLDVGFESGMVDTETLVMELEDRGDQVFLRAVDWLLSQFAPTYHGLPTEVRDLEWHLDTAMSGIEVVHGTDCYRLGLRLPEGVEVAEQIAVDAGPKIAGQHLATAIRQAQGLAPDTSTAMTEAIRAVEAAAGPVVIPKDGRQRLSMIVQALKNKPDWTLVLECRDDGVPDHHAVLIGMLETLVFAQRDRHAGEPPSPQQALAHVMLAATLVGWFSTGTVQMNDE